MVGGPELPCRIGLAGWVTLYGGPLAVSTQ